LRNLSLAAPVEVDRRLQHVAAELVRWDLRPDDKIGALERVSDRSRFSRDRPEPLWKR
jgi:hypothetical protein